MPITAANLAFQDYQFELTTSSGTWRWTTRMDVSGAGVVFQVKDIMTPFGLLRDTVPLAGDVVQAMADSITQLLANFPPTIGLGPPASLTFEVDEGFGFSDGEGVVVTNTGVYGSLLNAQLTTSAAHVTVTPAQVGKLGSNEAGSFEVAVDSATLLAAQSPYNETISVQDANATNDPQTFNVTVNVRPKAIISLNKSVLQFNAIKPLTGSFPPIPNQSFTIENTGPAGSVLSYQVQRLTGLSTDWLQSFAPTSGSLTSGGTQVVTVSVVPIASLGLGVHEETLRVSGYSSNTFVDLLVRLTVT